MASEKEPAPDRPEIAELIATLDKLAAALSERFPDDSKTTTHMRISEEARILDWRRGVELRERNAEAHQRWAAAVERLCDLVVPALTPKGASNGDR